MFDVTVYTDVRADEAVDGVAGFNFIAESDGVTGADRRFITQRMLHVVKSSWHVDHDDELAHPPSCVYRKSADRYYLSRGRSTGQTVTAPRPGNQVTQTILTSTADDFVPYHPAQLYSADGWNLSREAGGQSIAAWPTPLEIDAAYEADELKRDLVDQSPFGEGFLPQFLTMVEQAIADQGKKLIIVHTELDVVMRYIALASLFLDSRRALEMSFVAFADQPLATIADIVGATPDFGAPPNVGSGGVAFNVIDLLAVQMTPVDVSGSAATQAGWFVGGDPIDALAAIALARRWEPALGAGVATDAASVVSFTDGRAPATARDRTSALLAVCGLGAGGQEDDLAMYTEEFLDVIVTSPPSLDDDIALAADAISASHRAHLDDLATGILLPTLEALASRPDLIPAWGGATVRWQAGLGPLDWESGDSRDHALRLEAEILNSTGPLGLVDVLIAARLSGLLPNQSVIAPALDRLSDHWSRHPELSSRRDELPYQPILGAQLTRRLTAALESDDQEIVAAFTAGAWTWLSGGSSALAPWQAAVTIGQMEIDRRVNEIAARGAQLPVQSWRIVLSNAELPGGAAVVAEWIASHPNLSVDLSGWIFKGLNGSRTQPGDGAAARNVVRALQQTRATTADRNLARLIADTGRIDSLYLAARQASASKRNPALHDFSAQVQPYLGFFGPETGHLLVKAEDSIGIQRLERAAGDCSGPYIDGALAEIARRAGDAIAVEWALRLHESGSEIQQAAAQDYLLGLTDTREGRQRLDDAREQLASNWIPALEKLIEDSKKGRLTRNIVRGGKRLLNKER